MASMKKLSLLAALAVVACSRAAPVEIRTILVLPDGTYRFNETAFSPIDSRTLLGDPSLVRVNIKGCYRVREEAVLKLLSSLRSNGYSTVAFETGREDAVCSR